MSSGRPILLVLGLVLVAGCKKPPEPIAAAATPAEAHHDEAEHGEVPSTVRLAPEVVTAAGITSAKVEQRALPHTLDLNGELVVDPDRAAVVSMRVPARVVDVKFKEGDLVKTGQVLAVLESVELARSRATSAAAKARAITARSNADRLGRLAEKGLSSGQETQAAEAEATALEAEAAAAHQALVAMGPGAAEGSAARLELKAPIDGYVLERSAVRGQLVTADAVVAKLGRFDRAYFLARLFEKDLAGVTAGGAAEVRLNAYPNEVFAGTVESVGKQVDPAARTVVARIATHDHGELLKAGLFGTARIDLPGEAGAPTLVVPLGAVTELQGKQVVFVQHPDGDFEVHAVTLGRSAGGFIEVQQGLRLGEQVVVEGAFTVKSALLKSTFGEDEH